MKILQLCNKPPIPSIDGGCIAMKASANAILSKGNELKILAIETKKHPFLISDKEKHFLQSTNLETVFVDTEINLLKAFSNLFSNKSYNVSRFWSEDFNTKLISILKAENFDIIQLESIYVAPYIETIRTFSKAKIVFRAHNLEHEIWIKSAVNEKNPVKAAYIKLLAERLKKYELSVLSAVDAVAAISNEDARKFNKLKQIFDIRTIPVNIDISSNDINKNKEISLFFIGALDWHPNIEGLNWFLLKVWPKINELMPDLKFYIAGKKMPVKMKNKVIPGVFFEGEVSNSQEFMTSKKIMIVPLFSGSGVRIKILEAMACAKTVIATTQGAEGIECTKNENILIANTVDEFVNEIKKCVSNPEYCTQTGLNAFKFVESNFSTSSIADKYSTLYQELIKK